MPKDLENKFSLSWDFIFEFISFYRNGKNNPQIHMVSWEDGISKNFLKKKRTKLEESHFSISKLVSKLQKSKELLLGLTYRPMKQS